jgi:hypothetical protein
MGVLLHDVFPPQVFICFVYEIDSRRHPRIEVGFLLSGGGVSFCGYLH